MLLDKAKSSILTWTRGETLSVDPSSPSGPLTLSPELLLHRLQAALLLDELVDDLGRLLVLQLGLRDVAHVEQLLELGVQVVQLGGGRYHSLLEVRGVCQLRKFG